MTKVTRFWRQPLRVLIAEFLGYTLASAVALAADLGTLMFLVENGVNYLIAAAISFTVGLVIVYLASTWWIFSWRAHKERPHFEVGFFLFTAVVGLAMNLGIMWIGTALLGLYYLLPKIISVAFVFTWNFLSRKAMLFTPAESASVQVHE